MGDLPQVRETWVDRYRRRGRGRAARPVLAPAHARPTRTSAEVEARSWSTCAGASVAARTGSAPSSGVPARTVSRILRRHRVPRLAALDPITGEVIRASKTTAVRYERDRPGELVHMDVKKIGRIPDGGGWRAHGRAAASDRGPHDAPDRLRLRPLPRR